MLDLRRLRVLREVAERGSFSAAARALHYSQPAVSHHIARLEEEVGTPLVTRLGRGVRLTDAGRALVEHTKAVLARLDAAEEEVAAIAGLGGGRIRVAAFPSASATLVPLAIGELRRRYPRVRFSLTEAEPPESVGLLRAGDCDIALVFEYPGVVVDEGADFVKLPLLDEPLFLALPEGHGCARARSVSLRRLRNETWIAGCPRCRRHLLHACERAGFEPTVAAATDDYVAVQNLIAADLGVALLPALALTAFRHPKVAIRPVAPALSRAVSAVVLTRGSRPPAIASAISALEETARSLDLTVAAIGASP